MKDWMVRTIKTFIESFLGVVIPEIAVIFSTGFPESISAAWAVLAPFVAAGISAGITAVWNIYLESK